MTAIGGKLYNMNSLYPSTWKRFLVSEGNHYDEMEQYFEGVNTSSRKEKISLPEPGLFIIIDEDQVCHDHVFFRLKAAELFLQGLTFRDNDFIDSEAEYLGYMINIGRYESYPPTFYGIFRLSDGKIACNKSRGLIRITTWEE